MRCPPSPPRQAQGRIGRRSSNDVDGEFASRSVSHPPNSIHFLKLMGTSLPIASPVMPVVGADGGTMRLMPPDLGHGLRTRLARWWRRHRPWWHSPSNWAERPGVPASAPRFRSSTGHRQVPQDLLLPRPIVSSEWFACEGSKTGPHRARSLLAVNV